MGIYCEIEVAQNIFILSFIARILYAIIFVKITESQ